MNEDLNLKISQLIDDELDKDESVQLLELVNKHPELAETLNRYETVGSVIRSEACLQAETDFVGRISQEIRGEPVVLAPNRSRFKKSYQAVAAMAASVAIISVFVMGGRSLPVDDFQSEQVVAENQETEKAVTVADETEYPPADKRFLDYLEAHDGSLYAAGASAVHPYARVVSYGQE